MSGYQKLIEWLRAPDATAARGKYRAPEEAAAALEKLESDLRDARRELETAREALRACEAQWRKPNESHTAYFERQAERFYQETGLLAPGKSVPADLPEQYDERKQKWEAFFNRPWELMRRALRGERSPTT